MRTCDICGEKKTVWTFSKKELLGAKSERYETKSTYVDKEGKEQSFFINKLRWIFGKDKPAPNELIDSLEQKHHFQRKTRICKECIKKYPKLEKLRCNFTIYVI